MLNSNFCHTHVHSMFSILDGFGKPKDYIKQAKNLGFEYIGLTDHGNIDGLIEWQKECFKQGIKPISGVEFYIVPNVLKKQPREKRHHITVLIKNQKGFADVCKLLSYANIEGFYHRPRIDYKTFLEADLSNLVVMTACISSFLFDKDGEKFLIDVSERCEDLYLEIMPHDMDIQFKLHDIIKDLNKTYNIPLICSNDCHYILEEHSKAQEVLLAIQRKAKWNDYNRWKFGITGLHLRTADEMVEAFKIHDFSKGDILRAMRNTIKVAEKCCDFKIEEREIDLPDVPGYEGQEAYDVIEKISKDKLLSNLKAKKINELQYDDYRNRLDFELDVIKKKKFAKYFLIVYDLLKWCKEENIGLGPGRGSSGGSLLANLLNITSETIDPIEYGLLFERFIDVERNDLPDIDCDFEDIKRDKVRQRLEELYGIDNIASISTFGRMNSRGVIRDVARVFDVPYGEVDKFAKQISEYKDYGDESPITVTARDNEIGIDFNLNYPEIVEIATQLEGQVKSNSQHAAALVISKENLKESDRCNLCYRSKQLVVNWEKNDAEYVGLMKLDVLGLKTLTVINDTKRLIKENTGKTIDLEKIGTNDDKVYAELNKGNATGVFQFGTKLNIDLAVQMGIQDFGDLVALVAIGRPGAKDSGQTDLYIQRKHGIPRGEHWERKHKIYEKITEETYGILIFQEQILKVISEVAGLPYSTADKVRKIIGKKRDPKEFEKYWEMFLNGCLKNRTMDEAEAEEFWENLKSWAGYGFSKAHSVEYAMIGWWTAWLKYYYPTEFICASLTYGSKSNVEELIQEANRMGLELIPPKIGVSDSHKWVAKEDKLYIPFIEVKGLGDSQSEKLSKNKPFSETKGGFFTAEQKQVPTVKPDTAIDNLMKKLGCYDINYEHNNEEIEEYFDFKLKYDYEKQYPKLVKIYNGSIPNALDGFGVNFNQYIKKRTFKNNDVLECEKCSLRKECKKPVLPSIGSTNVAIIGDFPGKDENRQGRGFVGPAGKDVLWPELKKYGLNRRNFHITSVNKCYPSVSKSPNSGQINTCLPWLKEELKMINCRLALSFGNTCLKAFTEEGTGIMRKNGKTEWNEELGIWINWCISPASVLYDKKENLPMFEEGIKNFVKKIRR